MRRPRCVNDRQVVRFDLAHRLDIAHTDRDAVLLDDRPAGVVIELRERGIEVHNAVAEPAEEGACAAVRRTVPTP
jgi:hypothetical protein